MLLKVVKEGKHSLQLHHDEQLAIVLCMPFSAGHEISSVCCTQLPTVSKGVRCDMHPTSSSHPVAKQQPAPLPPPPPQLLPNPATSSRPRSLTALDSTSEEARSSPCQASGETSPTDPAQHSQPTSRLSQHSQVLDHSGEMYSRLHNTGRPVSASSSRIYDTQVGDGDCLQSFWPQSPSQEETTLVCREYLWIPSTLYRADAKSPGAATAVHLLSVMHPQLRAFPGSSQMR
jgi:hypothetical protein